MQVNGGSKIRNLISVAQKGFTEHGAVVWSGAGPAINKTISCAEILKRRYKPHQITKLCFRRTEEFWDPILPDLDQLVVERDEPMIHILLSREPLASDEPGYQAPGQNNPSFKQGPPLNSTGTSTRHHSAFGHSKKKPSRAGAEDFYSHRSRNVTKKMPKHDDKSQGEGDFPSQF